MWGMRPNMYQHDIEVEILVNGKPVKKYSHNSQTFIQANKGSFYSIKIKNNSCKRRLFICSVDGINVIDGTAGGSSLKGYVLGGYCSYEVSGFRTSNEEVHPFKFGDKQASYAAKSEDTMGDTSNCGVIGVKAFEELVAPAPQITTDWWNQNVRGCESPNNNWWINPIYTTITDNSNFVYSGMNMNMMVNASCDSPRGSNPASCDMSSDISKCLAMYSCSSPANETIEPDTSAFNVGTEFYKEAKSDIVSDTSFSMGQEIAVFTMFYTTREGLIALGVPVAKDVKIAMPQAFPKSFCKPPKN